MQGLQIAGFLVVCAASCLDGLSEGTLTIIFWQLPKSLLSVRPQSRLQAGVCGALGKAPAQRLGSQWPDHHVRSPQAAG